MSHRLERRGAAEFLGTAMLVATVVGSGIMGTLLSDNLAVTLLINAVATVAALGVLIWAVGPISGAHFNPVVTGVAVVRREMPVVEAGVYVVAQVTGALAGVAARGGWRAVLCEPRLRGGGGRCLGGGGARAGPRPPRRQDPRCRRKR